jgi:hypothetical protein
MFLVDVSRSDFLLDIVCPFLEIDDVVVLHSIDATD